MCTVTIIPHSNGIRLACNRDESRKRPAALPPRVVTIGARKALMPIDPQSGGTWIAVNDAGLIFTLLNAYEAPKNVASQAPRRSRGTIIPELCHAATLAEAFERAKAIEVTDLAAFRLVLADRHACAEVRSTESGYLLTAPISREGPLLFTSSGLGDALVDP